MRVKIKSGSWAGSEGKVLNAESDRSLLVLLSGGKRVRVDRVSIELLPREKIRLPDRHIGPLDFSNPYTVVEEED